MVVLILAGAYEWGGFVVGATRATRLVFLALVAVTISCIVFLLPGAAVIDAILKIALAWWALALVWMFFFPTPVPKGVVLLCGLLVLVPAWAALDVLYVNNPTLLLFALLIVWVADIGAYFVGKGFGRVKLAPKISPGKSWEGVLGGLTAVTLLAWLGAGYLDSNVRVLVPLCVAVGMISVVGDLTVSMFKRNADVKDSGTLFPGHGGVMDRIDSISAAVPLFVLAAGWIGLL